MRAYCLPCSGTTSVGGERSGGERGGVAGDSSSTHTDGRSYPGTSDNSNADDTVPQRPAGQRMEAPSPAAAAPFDAAGATFHAGFGFFPSLFGLQFQTFNLERGNTGTRGIWGSGRRGEVLTPEQQQQLFVSRVLLMVGMCVLAMLLFL
jgi:hypothetical protein